MAVYIDSRGIGKIPKVIDGVVLQDVINMVKSSGDDGILDVWINACPGGDLQVAEDIYDYLVSLKAKGKTIITHANGSVDSAATKILLAGDQRIGYKGKSTSLIHSTMPVIKEAGIYQSSDLISMGESSKSLTDELVKFYADKTGNTKEAFAPLVRDETELTADQMLSLGFLTELREDKAPIRAVAFKSKNIMSKEVEELKKETQKEFKSVGQKIDSILAKLGVTKTANIKIQDANGVEVDFYEKTEGDPEVGDKANVDGSPASGDYTMSDGSVITFESGVVTAIEPASPDEDEEMIALKEENETLKQKVSEMEQSITALKTEKEEVSKQVVAIKGEFKELKENLTANFNLDPDPQNPGRSGDDPEGGEKSRSLFKKDK